MNKERKLGMTLIEVTIAMAIMMIISTALTSFVVQMIGVANSSKMRATANRLADQTMEQIKAAEQVNKTAIQRGDWTSITNTVTDVPSGFTQLHTPIAFGPASNFYNLTVGSGDNNTGGACGATTSVCRVVVAIGWTDKGKPGNVTLTTLISKWQ